MTDSKKKRSICGVAVSPRRTKDHRSICGKSAKYHVIPGGVGFLALACCRFHSGQLERFGFSVREISPIEFSAIIEAAEKRPPSNCTCIDDPYQCPLESHQIRARQDELKRQNDWQNP